MDQDGNEDEEMESWVLREPWRRRVAHPKSVTDPLFVPLNHVPCQGEPYRVKGTSYWTCGTCGYIGKMYGQWSSTSTTHYPVLPPSLFHEWCTELFLQDRHRHALTKEAATNQMLFIMGVAVKKALQVPPDKLMSLALAIESLNP